jgi:hypothetical protein
VKPTVPEVLPFVNELYKRHAAGCCLHVVLDDGNVEDSSVEHCIENAEHDDCIRLAHLLRLMSKTQRKKLYASHG